MYIYLVNGKNDFENVQILKWVSSFKRYYFVYEVYTKNGPYTQNEGAKVNDYPITQESASDGWN